MLLRSTARAVHATRSCMNRCVEGVAGSQSGNMWNRRHLGVESYSKRHAPAGFPFTKIVATWGPATQSDEQVQQLVQGGARVLRLNFSHNKPADADVAIAALRSARGKHGAVGARFNLRAVMLDTQGPEIRTGVNTGDEEIDLEKGAELRLTNDEEFATAGTSSTIYVNYDVSTLDTGSTILLDDGLIELKVTRNEAQGVLCQVMNSGTLGSRKGVNLPGVEVKLPALSDKDRDDLRYGVEADVDWVAASFIRKGSDVREVRGYLDRLTDEIWGDDPAHPAPRIVSKIENEEALNNFESILAESDAIMVARGDLGVEIPYEKVTRAQKRIVRECNLAGKPVIVATQLLDSMMTNPRPTRAEVSDVTNAVYDGADAVMLSGETAKGDYPIASLNTMSYIVDEADRTIDLYGNTAKQMGLLEPDPSLATDKADGIAGAAVKAAATLRAAAIIVMTNGGTTARLVAKYRPCRPVMAFCRSVKVGRQLIMHRGIHPVLAADSAIDKVSMKEALLRAKELGFCRSGDTVIVIGSRPESSTLERARVIRIANVK